MTAAVLLDHEATMRALEDDEERRARRIRAELAGVGAPPARRHVPHVTRHLLVLREDGRSQAARYLLDWWARRSRYGGAKSRPVSTNEINRLAGIIRRLE